MAKRRSVTPESSTLTAKKARGEPRQVSDKFDKKIEATSDHIVGGGLCKAFVKAMEK